MIFVGCLASSTAAEHPRHSIDVLQTVQMGCNALGAADTKDLRPCSVVTRQHTVNC